MVESKRFAMSKVLYRLPQLEQVLSKIYVRGDFFLSVDLLAPCLNVLKAVVLIMFAGLLFLTCRGSWQACDSKVPSVLSLTEEALQFTSFP